MYNILLCKLLISKLFTTTDSKILLHAYMVYKTNTVYKKTYMVYKLIIKHGLSKHQLIFQTKLNIS